MAVPPVFVSGQVLTAAQMNAIGLWEVTRQTIGTAVASVTVSNAFTADFENYMITINGGVASTNNNLDMTLGGTSSGYYFSNIYVTYAATTVNGERAQNAASWSRIARGTANNISGVVHLQNPFIAKNTTGTWSGAGAGTSDFWYTGGGYLADTNSYTAFTLTCSTGTITGGTIRVYGYNL